MIKTQKIPRGPLILIGALSILAVVVSAALYGQFDYSELCPVCGRARDVVDWQVPGTQRTYYSIREERETPLSFTLAAEHLVEPHEHKWEFVRGEGNGHPLVFGSGHPIVWSMQGPNAGAFLEAMLHWTGRDNTLRWLDRFRDPQYSRLCQSMENSFQQRSFNNADEWEEWLHEVEAKYDH